MSIKETVLRNLLEHAEGVENRMLRGGVRKYTDIDLSQLKERVGRKMESYIAKMSDDRLSKARFENPEEMVNNIFDVNPLLTGKVGGYYDPSIDKIALPLRSLDVQPTTFTHELRHADVYRNNITHPIHDHIVGNKQELTARLGENWKSLGPAKPFSRAYYGDSGNTEIDIDEVDAILHEGALLDEFKNYHSDSPAFDGVLRDLLDTGSKTKLFWGLPDWLKKYYKSTLGVGAGLGFGLGVAKPQSDTLYKG